MSNSTKGFASMSKEKQRELASLGGKSNKNRHKWDSKQAREAGKLGVSLQGVRM